MIFSSELARLGHDSRELARRTRRGELVRVRRGAYVSANTWQSAGARQRHGLRAQAYAGSTINRPVFALHSAALLWGLPLLRCPEQVTVLTEDDGGGRSRHGIQKHRGSLRRQISSTGNWLCTDKARSTVELASMLPFSQSLAIADAALRAGPEAAGTWNSAEPLGEACSATELQTAVAHLPSFAARRRAEAAIRLASPLAESMGESLSRGQMHLLKAPIPQLQCSFILPSGKLARPDFYWENLGLMGEFDGRQKYLRSDWQRGTSVEERVLAEKHREDGLRSLGLRVVRWTWAEMMDLSEFHRILTQAGVFEYSAPAPPLGSRNYGRI